MCILFVKYIAESKQGEYKFILAANRDEYYNRPAKSAHFWNNDSNIFGGEDMTEGKAGGTWLALSKNGKIGVILNAFGGESDPSKLGRGMLIPDYLKSNQTANEFLLNLAQDGEKYNKFHLVTAQLSDASPSLHYWSNGVGASSKVLQVPEGIFAVGNSALDEPFQKVLMGRQRFEEIIEVLNKTNRKEALINELLQLLKWEQRHYPDPVIDSLTTQHPDRRDRLGAVCVRIPQLSYGTRTHTVILVDHRNKVDFVEWTMQSPIQDGKPDWLKTHVTFQLQEDSFIN